MVAHIRHDPLHFRAVIIPMSALQLQQGKGEKCVPNILFHFVYYIFVNSLNWQSHRKSMAALRAKFSALIVLREVTSILERNPANEISSCPCGRRYYRQSLA
jgi:hypothetical protein